MNLKMGRPKRTRAMRVYTDNGKVPAVAVYSLAEDHKTCTYVKV